MTYDLRCPACGGLLYEQADEENPMLASWLECCMCGMTWGHDDAELADEDEAAA